MSREPVADTSPVLVPLVLIGAITTFITLLPFLGTSAVIWAGVAAAAAAAIGAPVFWLARGRGLRSAWLCGALGALAGALAAVPVSVAIAWLGGVPIGWSWPMAPSVVAVAAIIGTATGAIYGTVFDVDNLPPGTVRWRTMLILIVALGLIFFV